MTTDRVLVDIGIVTVLGAATLLGKPLVEGVLRRIADSEPKDRSIISAELVLKGGTWIGILERLAIYAGILAGWPEAIAVVLAVKGLARYPELKATHVGAAERFIIGTLVSVLYACALAGLAHWLVQLT